MIFNTQFSLTLMAFFQDPNSILVLGIAILVLISICGVVVWQSIFSKSTDYGSKFDQSVQSKSASETSKAASSPLLARKNSFSSADTVTNDADDDIVDIFERKLSKQKTVEVNSDPSISSDDEEETGTTFSNSPTVDATDDASVSIDDDE